MSRSTLSSDELQSPSLDSVETEMTGVSEITSYLHLSKLREPLLTSELQKLEMAAIERVKGLLTSQTLSLQSILIGLTILLLIFYLSFNLAKFVRPEGIKLLSGSSRNADAIVISTCTYSDDVALASLKSQLDRERDKSNKLQTQLHSLTTARQTESQCQEILETTRSKCAEQSDIQLQLQQCETTLRTEQSRSINDQQSLAKQALELKTLEESLTELKMAAEPRKIDHDHLVQEKSRLLSELEEARAQVVKCRLASNSDVSESQEITLERTRLAQQREDLENEFRRIETEKLDVMKQLNDFRSLHEQLKLEQQVLVNENQRLVSENKDLSARILTNSPTEELDHERERLTILQESLMHDKSMIESEKTKLKLELSQIEKDRRQWGDDLITIEESRKHLRFDSERLQAERKSLHEDREALESERNEIEANKKQLEEEEQRIQSARAEILLKQESLEAGKKMQEHLVDVETKLSMQARTLEFEVNQVKAEKEKLSSMNAEIQEQLSHIQIQQRLIEDERQMLREETKNFEDEKSRVESDTSLLSSLHKQIKAEATILDEERKLLTAEKAQLQQFLKDHKECVIPDQLRKSDEQSDDGEALANVQEQLELITTDQLEIEKINSEHSRSDGAKDPLVVVENQKDLRVIKVVEEEEVRKNDKAWSVPKFATPDDMKEYLGLVKYDSSVRIPMLHNPFPWLVRLIARALRYLGLVR